MVLLHVLYQSTKKSEMSNGISVSNKNMACRALMKLWNLIWNILTNAKESVCNSNVDIQLDYMKWQVQTAVLPQSISAVMNKSEKESNGERSNQ